MCRKFDDEFSSGENTTEVNSMGVDLRGTKYKYRRNLLRKTTRDPQNHFLLSDVLLIRIGLLHVHYYSKPNNAQKLVCVKGSNLYQGVCLIKFLLYLQRL